uniref:Uncharacterized protein n=1 Tax=Leptocylindrus danicus TaxID=163516 RepID=A0A7S2K6K7_9STRA|mmetsp:Transcript_17850/g.26592  ORF Transcript_17850/g.26592 Transcript_17850/m.26592 type:complete len:196 (+) Transcript_17850:100-687(+)
MNDETERMKSVVNRLSALEASLACQRKDDASTLEQQCARIEQIIQTKLSSLHSADWAEVDLLNQQLTPSLTALSVSAACANSNDRSSAPILYRKQAILAQQDSFKRNLNLIEDMQSNPIAIDNIMNDGTICNSVDDELLKRMEAVEARIVGVLDRAQRVSERFDVLVSSYHGVISAASEKLLLLDEDLSAREYRE